MNQKQTDITTGKQIRHLRTQSGMTQEELAGKLNVTRQALSNWERDVNEPDLNMLKKICFLFGVNMDDFAKEVITKMETYEKKEKRQFNKYDMAIGLFYGVGIFLGIGIFFVGGFMTMSGAGWGASLFGGGCFSLVFGLIHEGKIIFNEEKDELLNKYAVYSIDEKQLEEIDKDALLRIIEREYGMEVLAKKDKMPRDFEYKPVTLDDIMLFYSKGEKVC